MNPMFARIPSAKDAKKKKAFPKGKQNSRYIGANCFEFFKSHTEVAPDQNQNTSLDYPDILQSSCKALNHIITG